MTIFCLVWHRPGLLLHTGRTLDWLAPGILAAPWWQVL